MEDIQDHEDKLFEQEEVEDTVENPLMPGEVVIANGLLAEVEEINESDASGKKIIHVKFTEGEKAGDTDDLPEDKITRLAA
jgi:hypothetical protein